MLFTLFMHYHPMRWIAKIIWFWKQLNCSLHTGSYTCGQTIFYHKTDKNRHLTNSHAIFVDCRKQKIMLIQTGKNILLSAYCHQIFQCKNVTLTFKIGLVKGTKWTQVTCVWFVVGMTINMSLQLMFQPKSQATLIADKRPNTLMYSLHVSLQTTTRHPVIHPSTTDQQIAITLTSSKLGKIRSNQQKQTKDCKDCTSQNTRVPDPDLPKYLNNMDIASLSMLCWT